MSDFEQEATERTEFEGCLLMFPSVNFRMYMLMISQAGDGTRHGSDRCSLADLRNEGGCNEFGNFRFSLIRGG